LINYNGLLSTINSHYSLKTLTLILDLSKALRKASNLCQPIYVHLPIFSRINIASRT